MCECYKVGGTFIDVDPDCPIHNTSHWDYQGDKDDIIAELREQLAQIKQDAARYRWLRNKVGVEMDGTVWLPSCNTKASDYANETDMAIDTRLVS